MKGKKEVVARLCGFILADGWLSRTNKGVVGFCAENEQDLVKVKEDLALLEFSSSNINYRKVAGGMTRRIDGKITPIHAKKGCYSMVASTRAFRFFSSLELPIGERAIVAYSVPNWIMNSSRKVKVEFVSTYLTCDGCHLSIQRSGTAQNHRIHPMDVKISKIEKLTASGIHFMRQLKDLLQEFDVQTTPIRVFPGTIRKDGYTTNAMSFKIRNSENNLVAFLTRIGYRYDAVKIAEGVAALQYFETKHRLYPDGAPKSYPDIAAWRPSIENST